MLKKFQICWIVVLKNNIWKIFIWTIYTTNMNMPNANKSGNTDTIKKLDLICFI